MRDFEYIKLYTEEEFEDIQANYNGKAEYDNGIILLSSNTSISHNRIKRKILSKLDNYFTGTKWEPFDEQIEVIFKSGKIIQYSLVDKKYRISDVFKNHDEYISTAFPDLKINLKDIFE